MTSTMTDSLDLSPQFTGIPWSLAECSLLSYLPAKSPAGRLMFAILVAESDVFPSREHKQLREARKAALRIIWWRGPQKCVPWEASVPSGESGEPAATPCMLFRQDLF